MANPETPIAALDYHAVFGALPSAYLLMAADDAFTIIDASEGYLRATRKTSAMFGRSVFEEFPEREGETTQAELLASLRRVVATRQTDKMAVQRYDLDRPGSDGLDLRMWRPVNAPLLSTTGEVLLVIHQIEDVTDMMLRAAEHADRSEAATALRATEILENMSDGFLLVDRAWRIQELNAEAQRSFELVPNEVIGRLIWEALPGLVGSELERACVLAMTERRPASFTAYAPRDGRWYGGTARPAPNGIAVYVRDVTEVKRAADERDQLVAESSRERRMYEAALSTTPDLVYVFDLGKRFVYANEALLRMWGVAREAAQGKFLRELGYEEWHAAMHEREIDEVVRTGRPIRGEVPFSGTDGRRIYDYIFAPVIDGSGEVVAVAGTTRDITDRMAAEQAIRAQAEQLRETDRAKDEFLAILAHELRNPLAPLRSGLGILAGQARDPRTVEIHDAMTRQVEHMVRLVDDLLEVSRVTRGTLALQRGRVAIADIVRHAVAMAKPQLDERRHVLQLELSPESLDVDGDAVRLAQIIGNLLNNAAKYTPPEGRIRVLVEGDADRVRVAVQDNGIGIDPALLTRMFEMFTRGDVSADRAGGLGIGLSLARRLAELHGGTLDARSEGVGKGAELVLALPRVVAEAIVAPAPVDAPTRVAFRIVVDDNTDAGDMLGMLLESYGATVHVVADGPAALDAFVAFAPDLVFLDIGMPGMDGYQVARALRERFAATRFTLVALTGWGQEDDKRRAREAGFQHHMVKPASTVALRELLQTLPAVTRVENLAPR